MERRSKVRNAGGQPNKPFHDTGRQGDESGAAATGSSQVPVRSTAVQDGSSGELGPVLGSGFQQPTDSAHPMFPPAGGSGDENSDDDVRQRAYRIWEEEGFPDGGQERHWLQAKRELRGGQS